MIARIILAACLLVPAAGIAQYHEKAPVPRHTYEGILNGPHVRVHYYDTDHNGCLDRAAIHHHQDLDSLSVSRARVSAFYIVGYTVDSAFGIQFNLDNDGDGIPDGRNTIALGIKEQDGFYNTGANPQMTYNRLVSPIQYEAGGPVQQMVAASALEIDSAPPVLVMVRQLNDGFLQCIFSEIIYAGDSNPGHGFALSNTEGARIADTGHRIDGNILYLAVDQERSSWNYQGISYTPAPPGAETSIAPTSEHSAGAGVLQDYWYNSMEGIE